MELHVSHHSGYVQLLNTAYINAIEYNIKLKKKIFLNIKLQICEI